MNNYKNKVDSEIVKLTDYLFQSISKYNLKQLKIYNLQFEVFFTLQLSIT